MKITRRQLRQIIKEVIEVHEVPVDLDTVDSHEAYGIGYIKGATQDPDSDDDDYHSNDHEENFSIEDLIRDLDLQNDSEFSEFLSPPPEKRRSGG